MKTRRRMLFRSSLVISVAAVAAMAPRSEAAPVAPPSGRCVRWNVRLAQPPCDYYGLCRNRKQRCHNRELQLRHNLQLYPIDRNRIRRVFARERGQGSTEAIGFTIYNDITPQSPGIQNYSDGFVSGAFSITMTSIPQSEARRNTPR